VVEADPENPENSKVNNASRGGDEGVLKFILVIRAIKEYFCITGCHLTQPIIGQKSVLVNKSYLWSVLVIMKIKWSVSVNCRLIYPWF
jgi:hypothetical protein